jgi:hypothetical protein
MRTAPAFALALSAVVGLGVAGAAPMGAGGRLVWSAAASGAAVQVVGADPRDFSHVRQASGWIVVQIARADAGSRRRLADAAGRAGTGTDRTRVDAEVTVAGDVYRVVMTRLMPRHPRGEHTAWVSIECGGRSPRDAGSAAPSIEPDVAWWGWADVRKNGRLIDAGVPTHVLVMSRPPLQGIALESGTDGRPLRGVLPGYLHVLWSDVRASCPGEVARRG